MTLAVLPLLWSLQLVQADGADPFHLLALRLPASSLTVEARRRPLALREAVYEAMARSVRDPAQARQALEIADRLARAHEAAWEDPFLPRQVQRFGRWSLTARATKVAADSLRRAGVHAFARDGPAAAITLWRRALGRARAIADTAGMAAVLDNIGAGLLQLSRLDSAAVYFARAVALAGSVGDRRVQANGFGHQGDLLVERGNPVAARQRYESARLLRERIGDTRGLAADHNNLGLLAQTLGDPIEARRQFELALSLNRQAGNHQFAATNLVNLAGLSSLDGDFTSAVRSYQDALSIWRSREDWADAATALHGLGQLELRRGDYSAARRALQEAVTIFDRTGPPSDAVLARRALADALAVTGQLQQAMELLEQAGNVADSLSLSPGSRAAVALSRADLAVRLNTLPQAERHYRQAEQLYRQARDDNGIAEARHGLGLLFLESDDPVRARSLLSSTLRNQQAGGNRRAAALSRISLAQAEWMLEDTAAARRQLALAVKELERLGDPVARATALGERAALEAAAGAPALAERFYRAGLRVLAGRPAPETSWRLRAGLARSLEDRGSLEAAALELRAALADLALPSASFLSPERRSGFMADKWDTYASLALVEASRGLPAAAFEASEGLRAREMLEVLARGRIEDPADGPSGLISRQQDLERRIAELTRESGQRVSRETLRGPDPARSDHPTSDALERAREQLAEVMLRLRERAPRHAAIVAPRIAGWEDVSARLARDQVFVTYLLSDSRSIAIAIVRDSLVTVDLDVGRRELVRLTEFLRGTLELSRSDSLWRGPLRRLHGYLIAPLEESGLLNGRPRLILVPHAELHYLPFAALLGSDERFLGGKYQLTLTPSASVWLALGNRPASPVGRGVLAFAPRPDVLPASRREVAAIERVTGSEVRSRIGPSATEEQFRREAPGRRILHLATYGVLNKQNPMFSFVELAPGGGQDGRLEVHEVFGLRLNADLVVLSACQTGLGSGVRADVPPGDDWVGLTRAFLHAGAARVMASLWPVDDWATAALMENFYRELAAGATEAEALSRAQEAMRSGASTAHPFYWAGFVLVAGGDPS